MRALGFLLLLLVLASSALAVGAPGYIPDGARPRIWLTSSELTTLAGKRDTSHADWTDLKAWCDSHIADAGYATDPADQAKYDLTGWGGDNNYWMGYRMSGFAEHLYNYGLAYQIAKQPGANQDLALASTYAARARTLLVDGIATALRAGEENNGLKALRVGSLHDITINAAERTAAGTLLSGFKNGYSSRNIMAVPVAYDWIYDTLSTGDKNLLSAMMLRWYDWMHGTRSTYNNGVLIAGLRYHEDQDGDCTGINVCTTLTGTATKAYALYDMGNNFGSGHLALSTLIALATYGDQAESASYLAKAKTYLNTYGVAQYESGLAHSGGDSPEGWNYGGGFMYSILGLYGYHTATLDPVIQNMAWPSDLVRAIPYRVGGDFIKMPMWGYWSGVPYEQSRIGHVARFIGIEQKLRPTSYMAQVGQFLLDTPAYTQSLSPWEKMFLYSSPAVAASPTALNLPLSYVATGNGLFASRSSWVSHPVVHLTARLEGKITTSHEGYDEGHISLIRGNDVLLAHQNSVGDAPPSNSFNTILFNNTSHHANTTSPVISIDRKVDAAGYSFVSGDITNAWKRVWQTDRAKLFRRSILHVRPGFVVVYDVTQSNTATGNLKEWLTQYQADPTVSADTVSAIVGSSKLFVKTLFPTGGTFTKTNPATGFWRVKYTPSASQEYDQFLNVIEAGDSGIDQSSASLIDATNGRGALIGGNIVAMFTKDQTSAPMSGLAYTVNTAAASTHYIADLTPGATYNVTVDGGSVVPYIANTGGVVVFNSSPTGSHTYSIIHSLAPLTDADGDGYFAETDDCNDTNPNVHPGAVDIPSNGIDEDCVGGDAIPSCTPTNGGVEICGDSIDQDCNGSDLPCAPSGGSGFFQGSGGFGLHL